MPGGQVPRTPERSPSAPRTWRCCHRHCSGEPFSHSGALALFAWRALRCGGCYGCRIRSSLTGNRLIRNPAPTTALPNGTTAETLRPYPDRMDYRAKGRTSSSSSVWPAKAHTSQLLPAFLNRPRRIQRILRPLASPSHGRGPSAPSWSVGPTFGLGADVRTR
jgi:hypothetical protein